MSIRWNKKTCPSCGMGTLDHMVKKTSFEYRCKHLEYEQLGSWCDHCPEGVLTGDEVAGTELLLDSFMKQVDEEEAGELA